MIIIVIVMDFAMIIIMTVKASSKKKSQVYNSIVLASDDETAYLTVSSTRFVLSDGVFEVESFLQHFLACAKLTLKYNRRKFVSEDGFRWLRQAGHFQLAHQEGSIFSDSPIHCNVSPSFLAT